MNYNIICLVTGKSPNNTRPSLCANYIISTISNVSLLRMPTTVSHLVLQNLKIHL